MSITVNDVHIGKAIDEQREKLKISKYKLGRRIGVPQQHVNRIVERDTMETKRLVKVSQELDFNFFSLFCPFQTQISANLSAVTLKGNAQNLIGDAALLVQLEKIQGDLEKAQSDLENEKQKNQLLKEQISRLDAKLKDKDAIIELLKERRQNRNKHINNIIM